MVMGLAHGTQKSMWCAMVGRVQRKCSGNAACCCGKQSDQSEHVLSRPGCARCTTGQGTLPIRSYRMRRGCRMLRLVATECTMQSCQHTAACVAKLTCCSATSFDMSKSSLPRRSRSCRTTPDCPCTVRQPPAASLCCEAGVSHRFYTETCRGVRLEAIASKDIARHRSLASVSVQVG